MPLSLQIDSDKPGSFTSEKESHVAVQRNCFKYLVGVANGYRSLQNAECNNLMMGELCIQRMRSNFVIGHFPLSLFTE